MAYLLCLNCGNTNRFSREFSGTADVVKDSTIEYTGRKIFTNNDGDCEYEDEEYGEERYSGSIREFRDSKIDSEETMTCDDCNSTDSGAFEEEEERKMEIWKHTKKDGKWSEEELEEKDRDDEIGMKLAGEML